jgi:hypothetical protein
MSLKALVQLFAEKFLISKKEWVAEQFCPKLSTIDISPQATGNWVEFIAPQTGYVCVKANAIQVLIQVFGIWQGCITREKSYKGFNIYVEKGQTVAYILSTDAEDAFVTFYRAKGISS